MIKSIPSLLKSLAERVKKLEEGGGYGGGGCYWEKDENGALMPVDGHPGGGAIFSAANYRKASAEYAVGDITRHSSLPAGYLLECTTAGITSNNLLELDDKVLGDKVTDGTATWTIKRVYITDGNFVELELDENGDMMPKAF